MRTPARISTRKAGDITSPSSSLTPFHGTTSVIGSKKKTTVRNDGVVNIPVQDVFGAAELELEENVRNLCDAFDRDNEEHIFRDDPSSLPGYLSVCPTVMFLEKIRQKAFQHEYTRPQEVEADLRLMIDNCHKYNGKQTHYGQIATRLWADLTHALTQLQNAFEKTQLIASELQLQLLRALDAMSVLPGAVTFSEDPTILPGYTTVCPRPTCLSWMRDRASKFQYHSVQQFLEEVRLLVENCKNYNGSDSPYTQQAQSLHDAAQDVLRSFTSSKSTPFEGGSGHARFGSASNVSTNTSESSPSFAEIRQNQQREMENHQLGDTSLNDPSLPATKKFKKGGHASLPTAKDERNSVVPEFQPAVALSRKGVGPVTSKSTTINREGAIHDTSTSSLPCPSADPAALHPPSEPNTTISSMHTTNASAQVLQTNNFPHHDNSTSPTPARRSGNTCLRLSLPVNTAPTSQQHHPTQNGVSRSVQTLSSHVLSQTLSLEDSDQNCNSEHTAFGGTAHNKKSRLLSVPHRLMSRLRWREDQLLCTSTAGEESVSTCSHHSDASTFSNAVFWTGSNGKRGCEQCCGKSLPNVEDVLQHFSEKVSNSSFLRYEEVRAYKNLVQIVRNAFEEALPQALLYDAERYAFCDFIKERVNVSIHKNWTKWMCPEFLLRLLIHLPDMMHCVLTQSGGNKSSTEVVSDDIPTGADVVVEYYVPLIEDLLQFLDLNEEFYFLPVEAHKRAFQDPVESIGSSADHMVKSADAHQLVKKDPLPAEDLNMILKAIDAPNSCHNLETLPSNSNNG